TRDHTERLLRMQGARVQSSPRQASVWPVERLAPLSIDVPGDFSSAAPLIVAATLLSGSELRIHDVNLNPTRTGLLDVLERMGAGGDQRAAMPGAVAGLVSREGADVKDAEAVAMSFPGFFELLESVTKR